MEEVSGNGVNFFKVIVFRVILRRNKVGDKVFHIRAKDFSVGENIFEGTFKGIEIFFWNFDLFKVEEFVEACKTVIFIDADGDNIIEEFFIREEVIINFKEADIGDILEDIDTFVVEVAGIYFVIKFYGAGQIKVFHGIILRRLCIAGWRYYI